MAQWVAGLTPNLKVMSLSPIKGSIVSMKNKLYPYCLVLVGSRNRFECDLRKQKFLVPQSKLKEKKSVN